MSRFPLSPSDRDPLARLREQLEDTRNAIEKRKEEGGSLLETLIAREQALARQLDAYQED
jgi:hypothetical protein